MDYGVCFIHVQEFIDVMIAAYSNDSAASNLLRSLYLESFQNTPDSLRMALLSPQTVNGVRYQWSGLHI